MKTIDEIINSDSNEIVQDEEFLRVPCETTTIEEGEKIAAKLFRVMTARGDGIGLAANQIGIQKRVCVFNIRRPTYLINPRIVEASGELIYYEDCLSFPNKTVRTKRYTTIVVECDNIEGQLYWDVSWIPPDNRGIYNTDVIEIVAVQHELAHLYGKTMFDFEDIQKPIVKVETYGRNDKITITNGIETKIIKYKNYPQFETMGYRILEGENNDAN